MKRIYGDKVSNLYMLEQNGFKVPPFMYVDENYIEQKEYYYLEKDKYFKKHLKDSFLSIRTSIYDEYNYSQYVFQSYLNKQSKDLNYVFKIIERQFVKFKKNINRRFIPGVIIQQMIPNKIISEININNNKIIIKQKNKKNKMFYFFNNVNKIKINVNKEYNNKLIKIIKKIKKLNLDFENLNLKLFLFNKEWYVISFNYY